MRAGRAIAGRATARPARSGQRGSASVEFAVVLPLAAVALLLIVQVALLVAEQLDVLHAAREGARAAAVENDDARARDAAIRAGALDPARAEVLVEPASRDVGDDVRVTVTYRPAVVVPMIARFLPGEVTLRASVSGRTEREAPS